MKAKKVTITKINDYSPKIIDNTDFSINMRSVKLIKETFFYAILYINDNGTLLEFKFDSMSDVENILIFRADDLTINIELNII